MAKTELTRPEETRPHRPLDVFEAMRSEMDRMFERFETGWPRLPAMTGRGFDREVMVPELDVTDDGKMVKVTVDLPGVDQKDVAVTLANGVLTVKGEKKSEREEKKEDYYLAERRYGSFQRSIRLPDTIDESGLEAKFENGVLKVSAPKKPEAVKAEKRIEIKGG